MVASRRSRSRRFVLSLIRISAAVYLILLLGLYLMENRLLYPGAYQPDRPVASVPGVETWTYRTADGTELVGRIRPRPGSQRAILFLHGNGTRANRQDHWIARISESLDAHVCAAEYRGFQIDDVTPHEDNLIEDSLAAHQAVCQRFDLAPNEVIVWGRSLGGGCAAAVAEHCRSDVLIMERTFDSAVSVAAARYPVFPIRILMQNQFDSCRRLNRFQGRLIQIHGTEDRVIPIAHGQCLHESVPSSAKHFITVPGLGHNDPIDETVLERVRRAIAGSSSPISHDAVRLIRIGRRGDVFADSNHCDQAECGADRFQ